MYAFPHDPKKIRTRIRRYERALRREQECYEFINDGAGKRYLLGTLYLLMGDTAGAVRSFAWCAQTFPDDSGDPLQYLCWTLALYRAGELEHAIVKLRQTMLSNLSLLPRLLGLEQDRIDMWYPSNLAEQRYSDEVPEEVLTLWEPPALQWAPYRLSECAHAARAASLYRDLPPTEDGATRAETQPTGGRSLSTAVSNTALMSKGFFNHTGSWTSGLNSRSKTRPISCPIMPRVKGGTHPYYEAPIRHESCQTTCIFSDSCSLLLLPISDRSLSAVY